MTSDRTAESPQAPAFADRLMGVLNDGALCLMISIGHRTGLFDAMRDAPPLTSADLASRAGLNERYVREWLGAMVTGRVVQVDPDSVRFTLPADHAAFLARAAAADNFVSFAQYIGLLSAVEDDIVECFRNGGGVPYSRYPRFHDVMAEDSGQSVMPAIESHILPLVPGLADRLKTGIRVLDAGCGRGRVLTRLAELFPKSRFVGMDLSKEATSMAQQEASRKGLTNIQFVEVDLTDFDTKAEPAAFDFVTTFDAVHDLMQDIKGSSHVHKNIGQPLGPMLYTARACTA